MFDRAFDEIAADWLETGRALSVEPTGDLAHTPACAANLSDFGFMMAWSRLATGWAGESRTVLLVTDDPWMFRHLAAQDGVDAGRAPRLCVTETKLASAVSQCDRQQPCCAGGNRIAEPAPDRHTQENCSDGYRHPLSTNMGDDGYFGT